MKKLNLTNLNGVETVDSRQVAEAIGKNHCDLLLDVHKYCDYLGESKIACTDFFIESTYITEQNKEMPCYLCTRKGCEMIANKLTGKKGAVFTALYVNAFHDMKAKLTGNAVQSKLPPAGEAASLIKTLRSVMKDQKSDPQKIASMAKAVCERLGIELPENFVEKDPFEDQMFLFGFKRQ